MSNKLKNSIITKEGYILKKTPDNIEIINSIKNDLTVTPHQTFKIGNMKPVTFTVYQENDMCISMPKFYGLNRFGKPVKTMIDKGKPIKIKFKSQMGVCSSWI